MLNIGDLRQLLEQTGEQILSLYLNVDPAMPENQAATPAWSIWLKNALKQIESGLSDGQADAWKGIRARVDDYFQGFFPGSKGLAMFYGPDFEQVYPLPVRVDNRAAYGKPLVAPLIWILDEYEPYLIVLVDHEKARFLTAYLGQVETQDEMAIELDTEDWSEKALMRGTDAGGQLTHGSSRDRFADRVGAQVERFYKEVARYAQDLCEKHGAGQIILGGNVEAAHQLRSLMSNAAGRAVIDEVTSIPMTYSANEVLKRITPVARSDERKRELALVDEVIGLAKSRRGRGAIGPDEVTTALDQGRVELLVAAWPPTNQDLVDQLTVKALQAGAKIELVHGEAADQLRPFGGVAARLYYSV